MTKVQMPMAMFNGKTLLEEFNTPYSRLKSSEQKFADIPDAIKSDWETDYNLVHNRIYDMDIPHYKGKVMMEIGIFGGGGYAITFKSLDGKVHIQATAGGNRGEVGEGEVSVREYNDYKGILKFMVKNKIVKNLHKTVFMYNEHLPVCKLLMPAISYKKVGKPKVINSAGLYSDMLFSMKQQIVNSIREYVLSKNISKYNFTEEVELPFTNDGINGFVKKPKALVFKHIKDGFGERFCIGVSYKIGDWDYDFDDISVDMDVELLIWVMQQLESGSYRY